MDALLANYVNKNYEHSSIDILPLMHSCQGYDAVLIIRDNKLNTTYCNVFKENLVYFFYGKPSYNPSHDLDFYCKDSQYLPTCFIVNPRKIKLYKVYPFDSGAYVNGRYKDLLHRKIDINTFMLCSNYTGILKYVSVFYGSNQKYIIGEINDSMPDSDYLEIRSFINFLNRDNEPNFDERANTIEIVSNESYILSDIVECVILPDSLLKDATVMKWLSDNPHIKCEQYHTRKLVAPDRYEEVIFQKVVDYLKKEGYI